MTGKKRKFSMIEWLVLLIAGSVFVLSAWQLGKWWYAGQVSDRVTEKLVAEAVEIRQDAEKNASDPGIQSESPETAGDIAAGEALPIIVDFEALQKINPDIVAWIYSPDTVINYPIVQGTDNAYYLHRLVNGQKNANGTLFMDCANSGKLAGENTIIYGHHMKNGSMFASLEKYKKQAYYEEHPVLYLLTPEKSYRLIVFAGFVTASDSDVYTLQFGDAGRQDWIDRAKRQSDFQTDVQVGEDEPVVTLSTCDYTYEDARYVVLGVLR